MEYKYTKTISKEQLEELVNHAIMGASKYWIDDCFVVGDEDNVEYGKAIVEGFKIKVHDVEEDQWHLVSLRKMLNGLSLTENTNFEEYDQYAAEQVMQRAVFGKLVYA